MCSVTGCTPERQGRALKRVQSRRRFIRQAAGLGGSLLGLAVLDGLGAGADSLVQAPSRATSWGPGVAAAQTLPDPAEVYRRLLAAPFEPDELPAGFAVNPPTSQRSGSGMQPIQPDLAGLVGALIAELRGPDLTNTIWYYLFDTEADAAGHFEYGESGRSTTRAGETVTGQSGSASPLAGSAITTISEGYAPGNVDLPAWCVAARTGPWGWTTCTILAGNVEVVGYSKVRPGTGATRGDDANAIALASAAVSHLLRLARSDSD